MLLTWSPSTCTAGGCKPGEEKKEEQEGGGEEEERKTTAWGVNALSGDKRRKHARLHLSLNVWNGATVWICHSWLRRWVMFLQLPPHSQLFTFTNTYRLISWVWPVNKLIWASSLDDWKKDWTLSIMNPQHHVSFWSELLEKNNAYPTVLLKSVCCSLRSLWGYYSGACTFNFLSKFFFFNKVRHGHSVLSWTFCDPVSEIESKDLRLAKNIYVYVYFICQILYRNYTFSKEGSVSQTWRTWVVK